MIRCDQCKRILDKDKFSNWFTYHITTREYGPTAGATIDILMVPVELKKKTFCGLECIREALSD